MKTLFQILLTGLFVGASVSLASAQYYDNYNYGYSNNPNNGVTTFVGGTGYNQNQNYNYNNNYNSNYNYNSGYNNNYGNYNYNYVQPVSVSSTGYNYYNGINANYNNNGYVAPVYNNSTLVPTTYAATNAYQTTATINGYVTVSGSNYNSTYGTTWFQYGPSQSNLSWSTGAANVYSSTNTNAHLTGLQCGTTYYFRAVSNGQNGTQYGNTLAFTTSQCNYGYNNYQQYPAYNWQTWQPPQIQTVCYMPKKKTVKKRYYR